MVNLRPRHLSPKAQVQVRRRVPLVHDLVEVLWEDRGQVFRGKLAKRLRMNENVFLVSYDDGDKSWHDLDEHYWRPAGRKEWVPPVIFRDEKPSSHGTGKVELSLRKATRKRPSTDATPKSVNEIKPVFLKKETPRKRIKPANRLSRKLSKESLSNPKDDKLTKASRVARSSVAPQSEASTQLSSSKGSEYEGTKGHELPIPTVTADTHSTPTQPDEAVQIKQSRVTAITTSSVGSGDLRVPPRKRNVFLSL